METRVYYTVSNSDFDISEEEKRFSSIKEMAEYIADRMDVFDLSLESFKIHKKIELTESIDVDLIRSQVDECLKVIESEE